MIEPSKHQLCFGALSSCGVVWMKKKKKFTPKTQNRHAVKISAHCRRELGGLPPLDEPTCLPFP
jgi:hypothetical protein